MALAAHQQGAPTAALRWFERNRAACGPPGLFSEEFDVTQHQLRGNLPQAFVHALLLEAAVPDLARRPDTGHAHPSTEREEVRDDHRPVVITGASARHRPRHRRRSSPRAAPRSRCSPAGARVWRPPPRTCESARRHRAGDPHRRGGRRAGRARPPTRSRPSSGPIDVWVNVAFTSVFAPFHEISAGGVPRGSPRSAYLGYVYGTMAALARMRPRNRGTIVQVGSALADRAIPLQIGVLRRQARRQRVHRIAAHASCCTSSSDVHVTVVQMPAVNTPQFSWVLSRLPRHPQPVPPIYQPELAARAVVYAADHPRRKQYWVGSSTVGTLLGQSSPPALLDRYLARTGYDAQQTDQPARRPAAQPVGAPRRRRRLRRPRHLRRPAHPHSPQQWCSRHPGWSAPRSARRVARRRGPVGAARR